MRDYERSVRLAHKAGVTIAMGTDFVGGKWLAHGRNAGELDLLVRYTGMSSIDALRAATVNGAKALGLAERLGTLRKGALADLLVIDGNPVDDVSVLQNRTRIKLVMKAGRVEVASPSLRLPDLPYSPIQAC
jgi:imidazolonepropionase-like amidohydrolase